MDVKRSPFGFQFLVGLCLALTLSGCDPTPPTPTPVSQCMPGGFSVPNLVAPSDFDVVGSLTPTLTWADPGSDDCEPTDYDIVLSLKSDFSGSLINGRVSYPDTFFTPNTALSPGAEYWWKVAAVTQQGSQIYYGEYSTPRRFFTPGYCEAEALLPPDTAWPQQESTIGSMQPLDWRNGNDGCMPETYRVELSLDPEFIEAKMVGNTANPATDWLPEAELMDCMRYYMRVTPIVESMLGPTSKIVSFMTDFKGACPAASSISGTVWHDLCAVPWGPVDPTDLPPGCVELSGGGLGANGIFESGEPGIQGVTIRLGNGACPVTGYATEVTDSIGEYSFTGLSNGTYCVSVDALGDGNDLVLIPGGWTFPTPGDVLQEVELNVSSDTDGVDFGWDYQFLPAPDEQESEACYYQATRTINCRESDYESSSLIAILESEEVARLIAIDPDYSHGKFELQDLTTCWIWFELLSGPENPQDCGVPIVDPPLPPAEVPSTCSADLPEDACGEQGGTWQQTVTGGPGVCNCP